MNIRRITIEQLLYLLILVIAIGFRVLHIDAVPLSDDEAHRTLQALQVSQGENPVLAPGPAYQVLTGLTFFLLADTNALARLLPILAGCLLVIFPYFIRVQIGRKAAMIMAGGLAFSPLMVAYSRLAGIEMMSVSFSMMAIGLAVYRKPILSGLFAGLALLSGPPVLHGLLGLSITGLLGYLLFRLKFIEPLNEKLSFEINRKAIFSFLISAVGVIIFISSLFFLFPGGLSAVMDIFPGYVQSWSTFSGTDIATILVSLVIYSPLAVVFGILAIINAWRNKDSLSQWLSLWVVVSLFLEIIYPGRSGSSWLWLLVPLWALASVQLANYFNLVKADRIPALGQAVLIFLLMALGWLNLSGLASAGGVQEANQLRWAIIAGTVALGGVTTLLVGLGWSAKTAQQGLAWGVFLALGVYSFSLMWGVSQTRSTGELELIGSSPAAMNTGDFQETLGDLSEWRTGARDTLDVVLTTSSPSLMWEMRKWSQARFLPAVPAGELPSIIVNHEDQPAPNLSAGYRGQDFPWWTAPGWEGSLPINWPRWMVFRDAPQVTSSIVLWARGDLFPGGVIGTGDESGNETDGDLPPESLPVE